MLTTKRGVVNKFNSMSDPSLNSVSWDSFADAIAAAAQVQPSAVARSTRLSADLGLDSLALAELVVSLIVDFQMEVVAEDFDERNWGEITAGQLYDEYRAGGARAT